MRHLVVVHLLLSLIPISAQAQGDSCACDRDELLANVKSAGTIFYGSIQEATMASGSSDTIQLTLDVRESFRGNVTGPVRVSTTLPDKCGISATLGMHSLFVVSKGDKTVTRCGGSGSHHYHDAHELHDLFNLVYAIVIVEFVDSDPTRVRSWLDRMYRPGYSSRADMEGLFSIIGELDSDTILTATDNEVIYRNLVFVFTDGVMVNYLWRDGA